MSTQPQVIECDKALDGARVLYRHFLSTAAPLDGWVREFSVDGEHVRISKTNKATDAGTWHRVYTMRIEGVLDPAKAPKVKDNTGPLPGLGLPGGSSERLFDEEGGT